MTVFLLFHFSIFIIIFLSPPFIFFWVDCYAVTIGAVFSPIGLALSRTTKLLQVLFPSFFHIIFDYHHQFLYRTCHHLIAT